jgi:integrase
MQKKLPETITEEEFVTLLKEVRKNHHRAAFILGFYQGMRISEVVNLTQENIRVNEKLLLIKDSKGGKDRHIPILKPTKLGEQTVIRALKEVPISCGVRALQIAFKNYSKKALNRDLHFHTLRHGCATWLLNVKKWDPRQTQRFLGHSRLDTTMIYTHVSPQDLVDLEWK